MKEQKNPKHPERTKIKHIGKKGKDIRNVICQLCEKETGESKEKISMWVGGFCGNAHESCMDIAQNAIRLWEKYILFHYKILPEWQKAHAEAQTQRKDSKTEIKKLKSPSIDKSGTELP